MRSDDHGRVHLRVRNSGQQRLLAMGNLETRWRDRKSTRLNSSHGYISYAVFCLKKKKNDVEADASSSDRYKSMGETALTARGGQDAPAHTANLHQRGGGFCSV